MITVSGSVVDLCITTRTSICSDPQKLDRS